MAGHWGQQVSLAFCFCSTSSLLAWTSMAPFVWWRMLITVHVLFFGPVSVFFERVIVHPA